LSQFHVGEQFFAVSLAQIAIMTWAPMTIAPGSKLFGWIIVEHRSRSLLFFILIVPLSILFHPNEKILEQLAK